MDPYYADASVSLYHGDCREIQEWMTADVLITDPPYGLGLSMSGGPRGARLWGREDGGTSPLAWDMDAPDCVVPFAAQFVQAIVWGGNYFPLPPRRGWLVWDKATPGFRGAHCELAWTNLDIAVRSFSFTRTALLNEGQRENGGPGKLHPTQKPLALMQWCAALTSGDCIADPFAGSGTTLMAARNLGRKAIGVEREEKYCEIIARRLDQGCFDFGDGA